MKGAPAKVPRLALKPRPGNKGGPKLGPTLRQQAILRRQNRPFGYPFADPTWDPATGGLQVGTRMYPSNDNRPVYPGHVGNAVSARQRALQRMRHR